METQKIIKLLNDSSNEETKTKTGIDTAKTASKQVVQISVQKIGMS